MTATQFIKLWHHCDWANACVLETLSKHPDGHSLKLFAHLVGTQNIWLARVDKSFATDWGLWDEKDIDQCHSGAQSSTDAWVRFLTPLADARFERRVDYVDTRGHEWSHLLRDIVYNVLNHSSHHRGQINARMRKIGAQPPPLDYMVYLRTSE